MGKGSRTAKSKGKINHLRRNTSIREERNMYLSAFYHPSCEARYSFVSRNAVTSSQGRGKRGRGFFLSFFVLIVGKRMRRIV